MIDWGDARALDPPTRGQDLNSRSILQLLGVRQAQGSTRCHWRHPLGQQHSYLLCSQETELRDLLQLHDVYELIGLQEACGESTVVNMTVESPLGLHIDKLLFEEISSLLVTGETFQIILFISRCVLQGQGSLSSLRGVDQQVKIDRTSLNGGDADVVFPQYNRQD